MLHSVSSLLTFVWEFVPEITTFLKFATALITFAKQASSFNRTAGRHRIGGRAPQDVGPTDT